jgi:hypothetical protein
MPSAPKVIQTPAVHYLDARGAYDQTQTDDSIKDGDVLIVRECGVVGFMMRAWPVALFGDFLSVGFHNLAEDADITRLGAREETRKTFTICPPDAPRFEQETVFPADPGTNYFRSFALAMQHA